MIEDLIALAVAYIIHSVHNAKKKAALKGIALELYTAIALAYAGDPDFELDVTTNVTRKAK